MNILVKSKHDWLHLIVMRLEGDKWVGIDRKVAGKTLELADFIGRQVRAVCISLEAEVAVHEVLRAPQRLNERRVEAGKLPIYDYHVVSLARRLRAAPYEHSTGHQKRFRRGHWRQLDSHRTWIKWMLVGSPDLGFVDKHYRL